MRLPHLPLVLLVVLAGSTFHVASAAEDFTRLEKATAKEQAKIAKAWMDLATYLVKQDLKAEAEEAIARARALAPELKGLDRVTEKAAALAGAGEVDAAVEKRMAKAAKAAAKGYERIAKVFDKEQQDARYPGSLMKAYRLAPTPARRKRLADMATKDLLLVQAPGHPMAAYVSLPKGWKDGKTWPVLVCVDGAGSNFRGIANGFKKNRGDRDWIIVSPHALSCTNEVKLDKYPAYTKELVQTWNDKRAEFDIAGLAAILDDLKTFFGASSEVAITGFSGGGFLCYGFLFHHPDRVLCAAPACANFNQGMQRGGPKPEGGGPPVHVMTGEKDPHRDKTFGKTEPGIEDQTDWVMEAFEEQGFTNVKRTMLPGVGHSALAKEVWEYVDECVESAGR